VPVQERLRDLLEEGGGLWDLARGEELQAAAGSVAGAVDLCRDAEVEPTIHEAERTLRAGVIWRKTSFGSKSGNGLRLVPPKVRLMSDAA
jgi:hypothetical protein